MDSSKKDHYEDCAQFQVGPEYRTEPWQGNTEKENQAQIRKYISAETGAAASYCSLPQEVRERSGTSLVGTVPFSTSYSNEHPFEPKVEMHCDTEGNSYRRKPGQAYVIDTTGISSFDSSAATFSTHLCPSTIAEASAVQTVNDFSSQVTGNISSSPLIETDASYSSHVPNTPHLCGVCGKRFIFLSELVAHEENHGITTRDESREPATPHDEDRGTSPLEQNSNSNADLSENESVSSKTDQQPFEFECVVCKAQFMQASKLKDHMYSHKTKRYPCKVCKKSFKRPRDVRYHMHTHMEDDTETSKEEGPTFDCQECDKKFTRASLLKDHMYIHDTKRYPCELCGKNFKRPANVRTHICPNADQEVPPDAFRKRAIKKNQNSDGPSKQQAVHTCTVCNMEFKHASRLKDHMFKHETTKYPCEVCGKKFKRPREFKSHMRSHIEKKQYPSVSKTKSKKPKQPDSKYNVLGCKECWKYHMLFHTDDKSFKQGLHKVASKDSASEESDASNPDDKDAPEDDHVTENTEEKIYTCETCKETFTLRYALVRHMYTHGKRPFQCKTCGKFFRNPYILSDHMSIHTGKKVYKCEVCGKAFRRPWLLKSHKMVHSGEKPFACRMCDKKFAYRLNHILHERTHTGEKPYKCDVCNRNFAGPTNLKYHKRTHFEEKPYVCETCGKSFKWRHGLVKHSKTHSEEKPYMCNVCGKSFRSNSSLKEHGRVHTKSATSNYDALRGQQQPMPTEVTYISDGHFQHKLDSAYTAAQPVTQYVYQPPFM